MSSAFTPAPSGAAKLYFLGDVTFAVVVTNSSTDNIEKTSDVASPHTTPPQAQIRVESGAAPYLCTISQANKVFPSALDGTTVHAAPPAPASSYLRTSPPLLRAELAGPKR